MKIYRVGGYVRDKLLNIESHDCDYVVVGSSTEEMTKLGYIQVGKSFPVFLHPKTREEYALARTEKKINSGHTGFITYATPDITLEEDLSRRDITINAIAEDEYGNLIDPYNGISDLQNKVIRHVSRAFVEDPLRVLRVARFAAKLNFKIAPETIKLMQEISLTDDINTISKERIINELDKALNTECSHQFFITLKEVDCLDKLFPSMEFIAADKDLWKELLTLLSQPSSKFAKFSYIGLFYNRINKTSNINELSLNKSIIDIINKVIIIDQLEILKNTPEEILKSYKQLNIWRDEKIFTECLDIYNKYAIDVKDNSNKVSLIKSLASDLVNADIKRIIQTSLRHQIADKIYAVYINLINNFLVLNND